MLRAVIRLDSAGRDHNSFVSESISFWLIKASDNRTKEDTLLVSVVDRIGVDELVGFEIVVVSIMAVRENFYMCCK